MERFWFPRQRGVWVGASLVKLLKRGKYPARRKYSARRCAKRCPRVPVGLGWSGVLWLVGPERVRLAALLWGPRVRSFGPQSRPSWA